MKEYIRKDGTKYPISISGVKLTDIDGREIIFGIIEDISERKAYQEKLEKLALYDPLTKLANRRLLMFRVKQSLAQCKREKNSLALLMLDLDYFKYVNDNLGHSIGDELLKRVARRIKGIVSRSSDTVARLGGDEFVIVLSNLHNLKGLQFVAEKILKSVRKPYYIQNTEVNISCSIGIARFPEDGRNIKSLLLNADKALYQVKNEGRDNFKIFEPLQDK